MTHYSEIGLPLKRFTAVMRGSSPGKRQLILGAAVKAYPGCFCELVDLRLTRAALNRKEMMMRFYPFLFVLID